MREQKKERKNKCFRDGKKERKEECLNEWMNEWMSQWMNERKDEMKGTSRTEFGLWCVLACTCTFYSTNFWSIVIFLPKSSLESHAYTMIFFKCHER